MPVLVLALALPLSLSTSLLLSFQVFKYELEKARLSCADPTCALAALGDEPLPSLKKRQKFPKPCKPTDSKPRARRAKGTKRKRECSAINEPQVPFFGPCLFVFLSQVKSSSYSPQK